MDGVRELEGESSVRLETGEQRGQVAVGLASQIHPEGQG